MNYRHDQSNPDQMDAEPLFTIEGVVERIVYENAETNFLVGRLRVQDQEELTTFVGAAMALSPGETVRLLGRWVEDKRFGRQLRIESFETILPNTADGIEKYLGSGLIEGIGPKFARRLVEAFGVETLRVIDEQPQRLRAVEGIGKKRAQQIRSAWEKQRAIQSIMVFLQGHGISGAQAARIYREYGDKAAAVLRENPYRLADDISGIGFRSADRIAAGLGIAKDSPKRLQAGLLHALRNACGEGHMFLPEDILKAMAAELLGVEPPALDEPLSLLAQSRGVVREDTAVYLPLMHATERGLAQGLLRLLSTPCEPLSVQIENAFKWVEKTRAIELAEKQREAICAGIESKLLVITGGPGTGKTTVLNGLLAILERKGLSFLLAAPTGRAAKRMESATDRAAQTLHRLLEFSPKTGGFQRGEHNPLMTDLVVVDEASMVDGLLMKALLRALPSFARLILVGDVDQLPSVGVGNVLFDIIASGRVPVVRLDTVFRQSGESGIVSNAHRINRGEFPGFNRDDFVLVSRQEPEQAVDTILELVTRRIPSKFNLDPMHDIQVLSPMRRGSGGVNQLNERLRAALNPQGVPMARRNFGRGDKVMQTRNNYDLDVYNGDTGIVTLVAEEASELEVTFEDGRVVLYSVEQADELELAYAATVHKSQGSEYPAVVLAFLPQHYMMLQRNLLYTAITRGKRLVVIVGSEKAIGMAIHNTKIVTRNTRLTERLRAGGTL